MESNHEELSRESWLIVHELKQSFQLMRDKARKDLQRAMMLPAGPDREIKSNDFGYAISVYEYAMREIDRRLEEKRDFSGWLVVRELASTYQNRLRSYESDLKRIAAWEQSEKRSRRIVEVTTRIACMVLVVAEVNRLKAEHNFAAMMKEKVRFDAALGSYPEPELTPEQMAERIAAVQAGWTEEEQERRYQYGGSREVEIKVCRVQL